MQDKHYVGDGVYVDFEAWPDVTVTTENGVAVQNRVVLEPEVYASLVMLARRKSLQYGKAAS